MKILYMCTAPLSSNSSASIRNIALIQGLTSIGHDVSIVAPKADSTDESLNELIQGEFYTLKKYNKHKEKTHETKIIKKAKNKLYKIAQWIFHSFYIYDRYRKDIGKINELDIWTERYDLLITSSDPKSSHLLGLEFKNKIDYKIKWVQYWGDPIYIDITSKLKLPSFVIKKEERKLISESDISIYVSPITLEKQIELYPEVKNKIHFLCPPYISENIANISKDNYNDIKQIKIGYYGAYYSSQRNIIPLYQTVINNRRFQMEIVGNTDLNLKSTENIKIYNRVPYNEIKNKEKETDILVCVCNLEGTQIPGKIYHYASTNKPILIIIDGEYKKDLKNYFYQFNRFNICENDIKSITNELNNIIQNTEYVEYERLKVSNPDVVAENLIKLTEDL